MNTIQDFNEIEIKKVGAYEESIFRTGPDPLVLPDASPPPD